MTLGKARRGGEEMRDERHRGHRERKGEKPQMPHSRRRLIPPALFICVRLRNLRFPSSVSVLAFFVFISPCRILPFVLSFVPFVPSWRVRIARRANARKDAQALADKIPSSRRLKGLAMAQVARNFGEIDKGRLGFVSAPAKVALAYQRGVPRV